MNIFKLEMILILLYLNIGFSYSQNSISKIDLYTNENKLDAYFYQAYGDDLHPTVILLHGFGGKGDVLNLGEKLSQNKINVLIFNFQGCWNSEGNFSLESSINDITSSIQFLKQKDNIEKFKIDTSCIIVGGHSFGGGIVLVAAIINPEIRNIISIAGTDFAITGSKILTDPEFRESFTQNLKKTEYPVGPIKMHTDSLIACLLNNIDNYDVKKHCSKLIRRKILFIGGWEDNGILLEEHILPLFRRLKELEAENITIEALHTNHSFSNVSDELFEMIINWIKEYSAL